MRAYSCDVCDSTSPGALGAGWLTLTQHNDADHGGDVTLHYCSTRCCEDDLDSLDLGGESAESGSQARVGVESHDSLCRYRDDVHLARHDCDLCALIARVRADERGES
jgi:hypothetical protein